MTLSTNCGTRLFLISLDHSLQKQKTLMVNFMHWHTLTLQQTLNFSVLSPNQVMLLLESLNKSG